MFQLLYAASSKFSSPAAHLETSCHFVELLHVISYLVHILVHWAVMCVDVLFIRRADCVISYLSLFFELLCVISYLSFSLSCYVWCPICSCSSSYYMWCPFYPCLSSCYFWSPICSYSSNCNAFLCAARFVDGRNITRRQKNRSDSNSETIYI